MNTTLIGNLIRLRYKLMWAKTRSRNGRIALFFAGYLLAVMVFALLMSGGFGAGMLAIRTGKSELVAQLVLSSLFMQALVGSVVLGFGMNAIFSDLELRRYPVNASERFLARHVIGIADPFWFFILSLGVGLAAGLYVFGDVPLGPALLAVFLLFCTNYLAARVVATVIDRLMRRRSGNMVLMFFILSMAILPSLAAPLIKRNPGFLPVVLRLLHSTPPFGAAAWMTGARNAGQGAGLLLAWLLGCALLLIAIERRPPSVRTATTRKMTWGGWYERLGTLFGPEYAPFVAYWLRFYIRNNRFRMLYTMAPALCAFLTFNMSRRGTAESLFVTALGTFPIATFMGNSRIAVNLFGYTGGGFRRLLLLPTRPDASLRAGSYASLLVGTTVLPLAVVAWLFFAPYPFDLRRVVMLVLSGIAGMLLFHAAAVWISVLNPRHGNYNSSFGNDLSLGGNILLIGGVFACMFLPQIVAKAEPTLLTPAHWWFGIIAVGVAAAAYWGSLAAIGPVFLGRRERLLALAEGKD